jgi:hypothetical protein
MDGYGAFGVVLEPALRRPERARSRDTYRYGKMNAWTARRAHRRSVGSRTARSTADGLAAEPSTAATAGPPCVDMVHLFGDTFTLPAAKGLRQSRPARVSIGNHWECSTQEPADSNCK